MSIHESGNTMKRVYSLLAEVVFVVGSGTAFGQITDAVIEGSGMWSENGHYYEVWRLNDPTSPSVLDVSDFADALSPGSSHLVTVTSQEENDFLQTIIPGEDNVVTYWIGAYQDPDPGLGNPNGNWHWITGEPWDFTHWIDWDPINDHADSFDEPNDYGGNDENYATLNFQGREGWVDNGLYGTPVGWADPPNPYNGFIVEYEPIAALIDIDPDTLNTNSHGRWITAYVTFLDEFDVSDIDPASIAIESVVGVTCGDLEVSLPADIANFTPQVGDRDEDAIPDLTVKFDRQALLAMGLCEDDVSITVSGSLTNGTPFIGMDLIRVIEPGKSALSSSTTIAAITGAEIEASGTWGDNGHYYEVWRAVTPEVPSFSEANDFANARSLGSSHLATITSQGETDFIQNLIPGEDNVATYWLGGYQDPDPELLDPDGNWHWVTGETWDYTDWIDWPDGSYVECGPDDFFLVDYEPSDTCGIDEIYLMMNLAGLAGWHDVPESWSGGGAGFIVEYEPIAALIDIDPDTLNTNSHGRWITAYITFLDEFDVSDIDPASITIQSVVGATCGDLEVSLPADTANFTPQVGDRDEDGIPDLTVKFDRQALLAFGLCEDDVSITVTGSLTEGAPFIGMDQIRVIERGKK